MSSNKYPVLVTDLEKDDRIAALQDRFAEDLQQESAFAKLKENEVKDVNAMLQLLKTMRIDDKESFITIATALLKTIAPDLVRYVPVVLANAQAKLPAQKGILVIYTGGTIGSAPKDMADPDSPQVVKPWKELKIASPKLGAMGYPVDAISFSEPLDSCNVGPDHWRTISGIIRDYDEHYTGFVVLHGTDSMAYTASALAFLLQELSKPIVITGAQIAGIVNARNDAHQNMITAVMLANPIFNNLPLIPEVIIAFGGRITRGCRSKKMDVTSFLGFDSPNYPAIGHSGDVIHIDTKRVRQASAVGLNVLEKMNTNVIMLQAFPGMQNSAVTQNVLNDPDLRGVVLQAYGAGNIPTNAAFLDQFKQFIDRGGIVVVTTMVPAGRVEMGLYETSQLLLDRGLIGAFDITPEAAMCKLMILLGEVDDPEQIKRLMQQSIVGEQSLSLETMHFATPGTITNGETTDIKCPELKSHENEAQLHKVILRFVDAKLQIEGANQKAEVLLTIGGEKMGPFFRLASGQDALGVVGASGESLAIDLTKYKQHFVSKASSSKLGGKQVVQIQVALSGSAKSEMTWSRAELNIYINDE